MNLTLGSKLRDQNANFAISKGGRDILTKKNKIVSDLSKERERERVCVCVKHLTSHISFPSSPWHHLVAQQITEILQRWNRTVINCERIGNYETSEHSLDHSYSSGDWPATSSQKDQTHVFGYLYLHGAFVQTRELLKTLCQKKKRTPYLSANPMKIHHSTNPTWKQQALIGGLYASRVWSGL